MLQCIEIYYVVLHYVVQYGTVTYYENMQQRKVTELNGMQLQRNAAAIWQCTCKCKKRPMILHADWDAMKGRL